jgi:hypothetical protein
MRRTTCVLFLTIAIHCEMTAWAQNGSQQFVTPPPMIETTVQQVSPFGGGSGAFAESTISQGKGIIVIVPKSGKRVWAFSVTTGKWSSVDLEEGDISEVSAAVGNGNAGFRVRRWLYGFGEKAGRWDKIQISNAQILLNPGEFGPQPAMGNYSMAAQHKNVGFAFSGEHGKWDRVALPAGQVAQVAVGNYFATLTDGQTYYYAFSDTSQEWGGVDLMTGEQLPVNRELPQ